MWGRVWFVRSSKEPNLTKPTLGELRQHQRARKPQLNENLEHRPDGRGTLYPAGQFYPGGYSWPLTVPNIMFSHTAEYHRKTCYFKQWSYRDLCFLHHIIEWRLYQSVFAVCFLFYTTEVSCCSHDGLSLASFNQDWPGLKLVDLLLWMNLHYNCNKWLVSL